MIERALSPGSVIEAHLDLIRDLTNALLIARATATELQTEVVSLRAEVEALHRPLPAASNVHATNAEQPAAPTGWDWN